MSTEIYAAIISWIPLQILNSHLISILTAQMRFYEQFWINLVQGVAGELLVVTRDDLRIVTSVLAERASPLCLRLRILFSTT